MFKYDKHIPNLLTLLNMFSGIMALLYAVLGQMELVLLFVCLGVLFDFFDGYVARMLNVSSNLGKELDSLADVITSGLVPGTVMFHLLFWSQLTSNYGLSFFHFYLNNAVSENGFDIIPTLPMLGFVITFASAYRLARFNIDTRQDKYFIGLPTPANALFICTLPLILDSHHSNWIGIALGSSWVLVGITFISAFLLNSPIRLFSLKMDTNGFKYNWARYVFVLLSIILIIAFKYLAVPVIFIMYFLFSIFLKSHLGLLNLLENLDLKAK